MGKENKASAPNDVTLSSSKTLAFVSLPSFPVNKFPRAARANWPRSPESGREQAVPRLPSSVSAPEAGGFHTPRAATARDRAGSAEAPAPPGSPTSTAPPAPPAQHDRADPSGQAGPRPQAPAPPARASAYRPQARHNTRAGPRALGLQAARRASPRLPERLRLLLLLLPPLTDCDRRHGSRRRGILGCERGA